MTRLERPLEAVTVEALRAGAHETRLGVTGQQLVDARHHGVSSESHRVRRHVRVATEVGSPCLVDDDRHAGAVRDLDDAGEVRERAEIARLGDEDGAGVRIGGERRLDILNRDAERHARRRVQRGRKPARHEVREHHAEEERAMEQTRDDDLVARLPYREAERLVPVRGTARRETAPVGAIPPRRPTFGSCEQTSGRLDGVDAAVERDVAGDDDPELLVELRRPALVPGRRERRGVRFAEGQVAVQERRRGPKGGGSVRVSRGLVCW